MQEDCSCYIAAEACFSGRGLITPFLEGISFQLRDSLLCCYSFYFGLATTSFYGNDFSASFALAQEALLILFECTISDLVLLLIPLDEE